MKACRAGPLHERGALREDRIEQVELAAELEQRTRVPKAVQRVVGGGQERTPGHGPNWYRARGDRSIRPVEHEVPHDARRSRSALGEHRAGVLESAFPELRGSVPGPRGRTHRKHGHAQQQANQDRNDHGTHGAALSSCAGVVSGSRFTSARKLVPVNRSDSIHNRAATLPSRA